MRVLDVDETTIVDLSYRDIALVQGDQYEEYEYYVQAKGDGCGDVKILWRGTEIECNRYFEYLCDSLEVLRPRYEDPAHTSTPKDPPPEQPF